MQRCSSLGSHPHNSPHKPLLSRVPLHSRTRELDLAAAGTCHLIGPSAMHDGRNESSRPLSAV
jgi:hypothetical protein